MKNILFENMKLKEKQELYYNKATETCNKYGYKLLLNKEDIINQLQRISYICPIHGERNVQLYRLLQGCECYECSRQSVLKRRYDKNLNDRQIKYYEKCIEICNECNYTLVTKKEEMINNSIYVSYICSLHGEQSMKLANFIYGRRCPKCALINKSQKHRMSVEKVIEKVSECNGVLLNPEDYINNTTKNLSIVCYCCGNPFTTSLRNYTQHGGQLCENCSNNESIGEKRIAIFLEENNIKYEKQKWFSDCRDINPLPFDFYIEDKNKIIEFDGRQHFEDTGYFTYDYNKTKEHDNIKNEYCKNKNIELIRIPYWEMNNIERILSNIFFT